MSPSTNRTVPVRPVHPALRRARRPYDSLTILTHPLPLAASVTAGTARGSSNHGHTHTVSNTCVHDESPQQFGQYLSDQCTRLHDKPNVPETLSHLAPPSRVLRKTHSECLTGTHSNFSNHTRLHLVRGPTATQNQLTASTSMQNQSILELIQQ